MRIGINASFARKPTTGIGQVTLNFIRRLARDLEFSQHEVILYLEEDGFFYLPKNFQKKIIQSIWKRDDLVRKILWEKNILPKQARKDGCEVFISLYQSASVMPDSIRHLMVTHDIIPEIFPEYLNNFRKKQYWRAVKKGIAGADKILAISKRTEKDLIKRLKISEKKITVAYIDADPIYGKEVSVEKSRKVLRKYGLRSGYLYFGGGLEARKNAERVLLAYRMLVDKNGKEFFLREVPPLVVSGKLMPELAPLVTDVEKIAKKMNLLKRVKFLGMVDQADLPALYKNAEIFAYPSLYEGFGLPLLEAMRVGVPTITSKKSSLPEVGGDGVLYCDCEDAGDLAMVMKNLLLNRLLRTSLISRGKERAKMFAWEKFSKKVIHMVEKSDLWKK